MKPLLFLFSVFVCICTGAEPERIQDVWAQESARIEKLLEAEARTPTPVDISGVWGPPPKTFGPSERMIVTQMGDEISGFSVFSSCMGPFPYRITGRRFGTVLKIRFELLGRIEEIREEEYSIEKNDRLQLRRVKSQHTAFVPELKSEKSN